MASNGTQPDFSTIRGEDVYSDLINMVAGDSEATQSIVDFNLMLYNKIEALEIEYKKVSDMLCPLIDRLDSCERELRFVKNENLLLRQKLALTEDTSRLMYLRLEGLDEKHNNNLPHQVALCLSKTGVICNTSDIDYVKRIGKYVDGSHRPIQIKFIREGKRNSILFNRANVNKNKKREDPLLWINDDVSDETRSYRKITRDVATLAKMQGCKTVKVHGDGIIVGSQKFKHSDLDLLPKQFSVLKAKSRDENTGIYFQSELSPFSNYYQTRFLEQGQTYESIEQAFQAKKAKAQGKLLIANKIMSTRNIGEIKRLAKQIPTSKDWLKKEKEVMKDLVYAKFSQNVFLKRILIRTGNKQLHEATVDPKWGTGADLSSKALQTGQWTGKDLLGQILEEVRARLVSSNEDMADDCLEQLSPEENDHMIDILPMSDDEAEVLEVVDPIDSQTLDGAPSPLISNATQTPKSQIQSPSRLSGSQPSSPPAGSQADQGGTVRALFQENTTPNSNHENLIKTPSKEGPPVSILNSNSAKKKRPAPAPPNQVASASVTTASVTQPRAATGVGRPPRGNQKACQPAQDSQPRVTRASIASEKVAEKGKN